MMRKRSTLMILPLLLLALLGCSRENVYLDPISTEAAGGRLVCAAESREQAQELAELYNIQLLDFRHGLAVFTTEENPDAVIERGREQGWPELRRDHQGTIS